MSVSLNTQFSASTASIWFGEEEVGELQSVTWDESTNFARVKSIGAGIDIAHLPGATEYTLSASRALLVGDLMVTLMQGTLSKDAILSVTGENSISDISTGADGYPEITVNQLYDALTKPENALLYSTREPGKAKPISIKFDVIIKDIDNNAVFRFVDCIMQSKRHRMDANGIIITQDVTLWARMKQPVDESTIITDVRKQISQTT